MGARRYELCARVHAGLPPSVRRRDRSWGGRGRSPPPTAVRDPVSHRVVLHANELARREGRSGFKRGLSGRREAVL